MPALSSTFSQGLESAKPAASSTTNNGYYYFATDTGKLWQSWGGSWVQVAAELPLLATDIPSFDASKVTTGSFARARLSNITVCMSPDSAGLPASTVGATAVTKAFLATTGGTAFSDVTAAFNGTGTPITFGAANDAFYIGSTSAASGRFGKVTMTRNTTASWVLAATLEYYNGAWTAIPAGSSLGDTTVSAGVPLSSATTSNIVSFLPPADWATVSVNGTSAYWVRYRCTSFTSRATAPNYKSALMSRISDLVPVSTNVIPQSGTVSTITGGAIANEALTIVDTTAATVSAPVTATALGVASPSAAAVTGGDSYMVMACNGTTNQWIANDATTLYITVA